MEDVVIDEPLFDASLNSFQTDTSEMIKYYYKIKFPDTYSLSPITVLDLLNSEKEFSQLERAVKSFINRSSGINTVTDSIMKTNEDSGPSLPIYDRNWNTNTIYTEIGQQTKEVQPSCSRKEPLAFNLNYPIQMPLRTYQNHRRIELKVKPYQQRRKHHTTDFSDDTPCSNVAEVTKKMSGLVFDRVEKPIPINLLKHNKTCLQNFVEK